MTREEADEKAKQIFKELVERHNEIIKQAKKDGVWKSGLDSNGELFVESDNEAKTKLKELASQIDE